MLSEISGVTDKLIIATVDAELATKGLTRAEADSAELQPGLHCRTVVWSQSDSACASLNGAHPGIDEKENGMRAVKLVQHMKTNADRMSDKAIHLIRNLERCSELLLKVPAEDQKRSLKSIGT